VLGGERRLLCWYSLDISLALPPAVSACLNSSSSDRDELGAEAFDLLLHRRAHVGGGDHGAEAAAVAIACRPATPTPITNTLAAGTVPAAVIIIGKARPKAFRRLDHRAVSRARLACDDSTSITCARVMRGISSMAKRRDAGIGQRLERGASLP